MIGVIADDLTGAAELGAVGLRHGLRAEILILGSEFRLRATHGSRPAKAGTPNAPDLVCITTESRSLPPNKAASRAAAAARLLRNAGAEWIYKKTDSVLRGQVTAELEAIMKELRCPRTLLLPANPSLGRTIRDGRYFIRGKPINRTEFARDPEHPRRSANVLQLLSPSAVFPVSVLKLGESISETGIFIGEVSSSAHVTEWIALRAPDMLLAGGAETYGAALRATGLKPTKLAIAKSASPLGGELFVCGSASEACRDFVNRSRQRAVPVIGLPEELAWRNALPRVLKCAVAERINVALRTNGRAILHVGLPPIHERAVARRLTKHLAELAAEVLSDGKVGQVFAEGGATAAALLRQMGWAHMNVRCELAPGVATLEPVGGEVLWLTIKPGSYRWPASVMKPARGTRRKVSPARSGQQNPESVK